MHTTPHTPRAPRKAPISLRQVITTKSEVECTSQLTPHLTYTTEGGIWEAKIPQLKMTIADYYSKGSLNLQSVLLFDSAFYLPPLSPWAPFLCHLCLVLSRRWVEWPFIWICFYVHRLPLEQWFPKSAPRTTGGPRDWLKWSANPYKRSIFCALRTTKFQLKQHPPYKQSLSHALILTLSCYHTHSPSLTHSYPQTLSERDSLNMQAFHSVLIKFNICRSPTNGRDCEGKPKCYEWFFVTKLLLLLFLACDEGYSNLNLTQKLLQREIWW